jgi:ribonuclease R
MKTADLAAVRADPPARVGLLTKRGRLTVVEPFFEPGRRMAVDLQRRRDLRIGDLVLLRPVAARGRRGGGARLELERSLGRPDVARDVVEALLHERGHHRRFPPAVESEAHEAATSSRHQDPVEHARRDLTALPTFTIDPASARDYDDALSVEHDGDGLRLHVHIADVAAFVRPGGALDGEAQRRGNSVYVPGAVEPMLPHALSSEACSLVPGVPRSAVTAEISIGPGGQARRSSFYRSLIRSDARFEYGQVDRIFAGAEQPPAAVAEPLSLARALAGELRAARLARGALGVESSEPGFEFDDAGNVVAARDEIQTEAHWVIEHLMILANEQVARRLESARAGALFRVHEQPDPAAIERLVAQLESLEVPTPPVPKVMSPTDAARLVGEISTTVMEYQRATGRGKRVLTSLVLRALKQAYYSARNIGHAGLASQSYCHFTSPIRRFPDLVVHRALLATLGAGEEPPSGDLEEVAAWCSATEREAAALEHAADDVCFAFLLERVLGERDRNREQEFDGEVTGVIEAGAFVAFDPGAGGAACEGLLPVRRMRGDWYDLNEQRTALVGRRTGNTLRLADPVTVTVRSVEPARGRVDLELAGWSDR